MRRRSARQGAAAGQATKATGASPAEAWEGSSYGAGLAFSLASFGCIGIVALFTSVLSARLYGIAVIGQAALALAPVTVVSLLSTVREQPAMVRELARFKPMHPRVTGVSLAVFAFSFGLTALATVLGLVICFFVFRGPLHHPQLFAPAAVSLGGYLLVINTCWNADSVFGAFRAGRELFAVRLHQASAYAVLLIVFSTITRSVWGLVLAFLGSWLTALIHRLLLLRRVMPWRVPIDELRAGFATLREIVGFGLKLTPGSLASGFSDASATWILGATTSVAAVGAFSRAWGLAGRLTELNWRITEMLLPTLVRRRDLGDREGFDRVLVDSLRYAAFGLLLPAAAGGGAADGIMRLFGPGFQAAAPALRWLLFVPLLQTLMAILGSGLMVADRPIVTSIVQIGRLLLTLVGGVLLTLTLGLTGMALALSGAALVSFFVYLLLLRVRVGGVLPSSTHGRQVVALGAAYAAGFALSHVIERSAQGALGLGAALVLGSLAYAAVGVGLGGTTDRDRDRLRRAIAYLGARRAALLRRPQLT